DVQAEALADQRRVLRKQLDALHGPTVLPGEPEHRPVTAPEVEEPARWLRVPLDEGVGLAVAAVLARWRRGIYVREDVLLLVDPGACVVHHQSAPRTPMEPVLMPVTLGVEKRQVLSAAQLAVHS